MTENIAPPASVQNDRIMAALVHVTVLLPMMGIIAPIVIWATQKDKSQFVAFQALQAIAYQLLFILAYFVGMGCYGCSFFSLFALGPLATLSSGTTNNIDPFFELGFFFPLSIIGVMFLFGGFFIIYGLYATIRVFQGKDFRYAFLGNWLERYLNQP